MRAVVIHALAWLVSVALSVFFALFLVYVFLRVLSC